MLSIYGIPFDELPAHRRDEGIAPVGYKKHSLSSAPSWLVIALAEAIKGVGFPAEEPSFAPFEVDKS